MSTPIPAATIRAQITVPLQFADGFETIGRLFTFDGLVDGKEHIAIGLGSRADSLTPRTARVDVPLIRPHSECLTGDVLGSQRCDCGAQLREAIQRITQAGGYLLYLRQEGRGIGLSSKIDAYVLQDDGLDTYDANIALGFAADGRDYTVAAQMLQALGALRVSLLSNNPDKESQLSRLGVSVVSRVSTAVHVTETNREYLSTKARRGSHELDLAPSDRAVDWVGDGAAT